MSRIVVQFDLDVKKGTKTLKVESPFDSKAKASDKIKSMLESTASSSSAMMRISDSSTGDFIFVNTMKLSDVRIMEEEE